MTNLFFPARVSLRLVKSDNSFIHCDGINIIICSRGAAELAETDTVVFIDLFLTQKKILTSLQIELGVPLSLLSYNFVLRGKLSLLSYNFVLRGKLSLLSYNFVLKSFLCLKIHLIGSTVK